MRILYSLLTYLLQIPVAAYWLFRAVGNRSYRKGIGQRFGIGYPNLSGCIWIHAVSVGEVQAAVPLIREIGRRFPRHRLLITTVTPTGAARVKALFGDTVVHLYIPFEMPLAVNRFFDSVKPRLALIMETEIWPNVFHHCAKARIPLIVANARLSQRSVRGYARVRGFARQTLANATLIAAQSEADAERFRSLGAPPDRLRVMGNVKFDMSLPDGLLEQGRALREELGAERPVLIAASTHGGEDEQVLAAFEKLRTGLPELLLILVPRHPERFGTVAELSRQRGLAVVKRSERQACDANTQVFLGDTMGELMLFFAASDVAFVGGSLVPTGGHNVLEPALVGLPVLFGPHMFNFTEIARRLLDAEAAWEVPDGDGLAREAGRLFADPGLREQAGQRGKAVVDANRGALARLLAMIDDVLKRG